MALLWFSQGQAYPVIPGDERFTLNIAGPAEPPSFTGSKANEYLYAQLNGKAQGTAATPDDFALLMIRAKQLLEASYSIRTVAELSASKKELHAFVRDQYQNLRHSDMVRRLVAQYFMMHEYVAYHTED